MLALTDMDLTLYRPNLTCISEQCTSKRHYSSCSLDIKQDCTGKQACLTFKLVFVYFSSATLPSTGHEVGKFHDSFIAHLFDMATRNHWGWKRCVCSQPVLSDDPAKHCSLEIISKAHSSSKRWQEVNCLAAQLDFRNYWGFIQIRIKSSKSSSIIRWSAWITKDVVLKWKRRVW